MKYLHSIWFVLLLAACNPPGYSGATSGTISLRDSMTILRTRLDSVLNLLNTSKGERYWLVTFENSRETFFTARIITHNGEFISLNNLHSQGHDTIAIIHYLYEFKTKKEYSDISK